MPKYSPKQLKGMAQTFLVDHAANGDKAFAVVMTMSLRTGMSPDAIVGKIKELAL